MRLRVQSEPSGGTVNTLRLWSATPADSFDLTEFNQGDFFGAVSDRVLAVAKSDAGEFLTDTHVSGVHLRVITTPYTGGFAVQIARPLTEVDHSLGRIRSLSRNRVRAIRPRLGSPSRGRRSPP